MTTLEDVNTQRLDVEVNLHPQRMNVFIHHHYLYQMKEKLINYENWRKKQPNLTPEELVNNYLNQDIKKFVTFYYPGSFMSEETTTEITNRSDIEVPDYSFGYRFYDTIGGEIVNKTGMYYFGESFSTKDIEALNTDGKLNILLDNMKCNNWNTVVKTRANNYQPLLKGDVIVDINYFREHKLKRILNEL